MESMSVDFLDNVPVGIKFKFDSPKTGIGKNGKPYILHGRQVYKDKTWVDGSFFATDFLQTLIEFSGCRKDTVCTIEKKQVPDDKKKKYWKIRKQGEDPITTDEIPKDFKAVHVSQKQEQPAERGTAQRPQYTMDGLLELYASISAQFGFSEIKAGFIFLGAVLSDIYILGKVAQPKQDDLPWEDDVPAPNEDDLPF